MAATTQSYLDLTASRFWDSSLRCGRRGIFSRLPFLGIREFRVERKNEGRFHTFDRICLTLRFDGVRWRGDIEVHLRSPTSHPFIHDMSLRELFEGSLPRIPPSRFRSLGPPSRPRGAPRL